MTKNLKISVFLLVSSPAFGKTKLIPLGNEHYATVSDIQFIQRTLIGILITLIGWLIAFVITRFFKKNDTTEATVSEIAKAVARLEGTVTYIERTSVKKEDLVELIRREITYSKDV